MWRTTLSVTICVMAVVTYCVNAFNPDKIKCCQCRSMMPDRSGVDPQILPSPFVIKVAPNARTYTPGLDINVNLTSIDENRSFRSFMIQARRMDPDQDINEPIGSFSPLDAIDAVQDCGSTYGSALVSAESNIQPKTNVRLVWNPYRNFQGHIEFRATFVEDEDLFWVKEKSGPIYDPMSPLPPDVPPKYILPPIPGIDVTGCGSTKGCYRLPEDCLEIECEYIFTWSDKGNHMVFEMSALTDGFNDRYFAVGLSEDIYMGKDMVFECVHNSTSGKVEVYQSFNQENKNIRLYKPKSGITFQEGSYNSGRLRCRFHKLKRPIEAEDFDFTNRAYHLLMARGPSSNGNLKRHGLTVGHLPAVSPDEVDILVYEDISGRARYHLVKAHACLMLLAWVFFAPIGLIWMKYYTTMWPNSKFLGSKYWFVAHVNCTFWVVLLVFVGVIIIFFEAGGWSKFPELPQKAHPILGIIVFISVLVIPIIAMFRCCCTEKHTCRPVGNWFYWLFWTIAFCLAIPNIFIGMEFGKAMVPWWLTWILCIFFLFNLICEVILEVHQCCTHKKNKERRKKWELQKKENPNVHIPEPWPAGRNFKRNVLITHFIVCLIVVIISVIVVAVS